MNQIGTTFKVWPMRELDDPAPLYCVRCGRVLELRYWSTVGKDRRYWYLACDGDGWTRLMNRLFGWAAITYRGHWRFDLGSAPEPETFDPGTGEMVNR